MTEIKIGAIVELRGSTDNWRLINTQYDGHVHKFIIQSTYTGEVKSVFKNEIFDKNSSTYKEINEFFESQLLTDLLFEDSFELYADVLPPDVKEAVGLALYPESTAVPDNSLETAYHTSTTAFCDTVEPQAFDNNEPLSTEPVKKRFKTVTRQQINDMKDKTTEVTTKRQTKWAVNLLNAWMVENGYTSTEFEMWPLEEIDSLLESFYTALRTKSGGDYSKAALVGIRAGINRHITSPPFSRKLSLMRDREFMSSNQVLTGMIKTLKREGKDVSEHKEPITAADKNKLYQSGIFSEDEPQTLQNKVQFDIMSQFGRRGREGLHSLKKTSFAIAQDSNGYKYVKMSFNECDKNHHGLDSREQNKQPRMYETKKDYCPVKSFEKYLSKLNPESESFFQRPLSKVMPDSQFWYSKVSVGVNKLFNFMPRISAEANLSQRYTNHCIRATVTSNLHSAGVSSTDIMSVTGHRNVQSLTSYIRPSEENRKKISGLLSHSASEDDVHQPAVCPILPDEEHQPATQSLSLFAMNETDTDKQVNIKMSKSAASCQILSGNITSSTINVNIYHAK